MSLWVIRTFFLLLCTAAGYAVSQARPDITNGGFLGILTGVGLGSVLIGVDHMLKGFSLRAFSAATGFTSTRRATSSTSAPDP